MGGLDWFGVLDYQRGMGFVYAYKNGWFDELPGFVKLILISMVGFA